MTQQQQAANGVELDGAANGVPDVIGVRTVKDGDFADFAAVLAGIDGARALVRSMR